MDYFFAVCYNRRMLDESLLKNGQTVAVALSGGKDSVCLLDLLLEKSARLSLTVKAINVEHGIRGQASVSDSEFCKRLCDKLGVPLKSYSVNAPAFAAERGISEETAARLLRYRCFEDALSEGFCDVIATAHHLSDSVETVLFNLFRGTSAKGACGIAKSANDGKIIRPLLNAKREQIDEHAKKRNLKFVQDETNFCSDYSRNYIRNRIVPVIEERFPSATDKIADFSAVLREEDEYLDKIALKLVHKNQVLFCADDVPFKRACLIVMKECGFKADYESVHLRALCKLKKCECGKSVDLKNGLIAKKTHDGIVFEKKSNTAAPEEIPFSLGKHDLGIYELTFEKADEKEAGFLYFDLDKLPENAVIRTRREGDKITAFGGKNKKLKKYLTDKKIEARLSARFPLIAFGDEIFAVCPIDISEKIKTDDNTARMIKIVCTEKGDD